MKINPHIHFNGNTEAAFKFYRSVIGGEFKRIMRFSDLVSDEFAFPEEELTKIMHIDLTIGQITVLTGSDVPAMFGQVSEEENRSKICLSADSKEEANALFAGLSVGGSIEFPLGDGPWGTYFGAFRDQFGIEWMIEYVGMS